MTLLCAGLCVGTAASADLGDTLGDPTAADAAVLDSTAATEILREADLGAALVDDPAASAPSPAKAASAPGRTAPKPALPAKQATGDDDPFGLRPRVKAAWEWVKDSVPWLESSDAPEARPQPAPPAHPGWDGPGLGDPLDQRAGGATGWGLSSGAGRGTTAASPVPELAQPHRGADTPVQALLESLREVTAMIREALLHPMSWLIAALVAIGAFAIRKFDRRPK